MIQNKEVVNLAPTAVTVKRTMMMINRNTAHNFMLANAKKRT